MHVLITGGAGFLGRHLSKALINESYQVTVLDNLSTGNLQNLISIPSKGTFRFVKGDIRSQSIVREAMRDVETVIHLAAVVSVPYSVMHPQETYDVNVDGTRNLSRSSVESNVERFIYVSSCAVYGEPRYLL